MRNVTAPWTKKDEIMSNEGDIVTTRRINDCNVNYVFERVLLRPRAVVSSKKYYARTMVK